MSGEYELSFTSDDGCRLWVDDKLVIDAWGGHQVRSDNVKINLEAGKEYSIKAEYWNNLD